MTIPYFDPAISCSERQSRLRDTYGFDCSCKLCTIQSPMDIHPVDEPRALALVNTLEAKLHRFAFGERGITADFQLPKEQLCFELPRDLQPLMDDTILSVLTKRFSLAPDEQLFELAMTTGKTVLAIYLCIYPPHFPQIGTCINCAVSSAESFT